MKETLISGLLVLILLSVTTSSKAGIWDEPGALERWIVTNSEYVCTFRLKVPLEDLDKCIDREKQKLINFYETRKVKLNHDLL